MKSLKIGFPSLLISAVELKSKNASTAFIFMRATDCALCKDGSINSLDRHSIYLRGWKSLCIEIGLICIWAALESVFFSWFNCSLTHRDFNGSLDIWFDFSCAIYGCISYVLSSKIVASNTVSIFDWILTYAFNYRFNCLKLLTK